MNLCKIRLDKKIKELSDQGLLAVLNLLLVSPEFFESLKFELSIEVKYFEKLDKNYIDYNGVKIVPYSKLYGNYMLPFICPTKVS